MKMSLLIVAIWLVASWPYSARAQEGVQVVPVGEKIKPEGSAGETQPSAQTQTPKAAPTAQPAKPKPSRTEAAKKSDSTSQDQASKNAASKPDKKENSSKKKPSAAVAVPKNTNFIVQLATSVSSGLTRQGDTVYFTAFENVGGSKRPIVAAGARGLGSVQAVKDDKKEGELIFSLDSIESTSGKMLKLSGQVHLQGEGTHAAAAVGERFTATLTGQPVAGASMRKAKIPQFALKASVEVLNKEIKANLFKGYAKDMIDVLLEAPKGLDLLQVAPETLLLYRVNESMLPEPVRPAKAEASAAQSKKSSGGRPLPVSRFARRSARPAQPSPATVEQTLGTQDRNDNGIPDLTMQFDTWSFVRSLPRGNNIVYVKGKMKDGTEFDASTGVKIEY